MPIPDRWVIDRTNLERAADSLLTISSPQGLASIRSWRSVPDVRRLLEQVAYSSEAYSEELEQDLIALLSALDVVESGR